MIAFINIAPFYPNAGRRIAEQEMHLALTKVSLPIVSRAADKY